MNESKIEATHRLQHDGRWAEASAFRDRVRKERRAAGDTRDVANEAAWAAMAQEFPPMPVSTSQEVSTRTREPMDDPFSDDDDSALLPENLLPGAATCASDMAWAYQNLCSPVTANEAPSGAAFALRAWGRSDKGRDKFFAVALKFLAPKDAANGRLKDDRARQFGLLADLGREFAGIEQRCPLCNGVFTDEQQAAQTKLAQSTPPSAAHGTNAGSRFGAP